MLLETVQLYSAHLLTVGYLLQAGLMDLYKPVQADFTDLPFADNTFDAAFAIEATCHAPKVSF